MKEVIKEKRTPYIEAEDFFYSFVIGVLWGALVFGLVLALIMAVVYSPILIEGDTPFKSYRNGLLASAAKRYEGVDVEEDEKNKVTHAIAIGAYLRKRVAGKVGAKDEKSSSQKKKFDEAMKEAEPIIALFQRLDLKEKKAQALAHFLQTQYHIPEEIAFMGIDWQFQRIKNDPKHMAALKVALTENTLPEEASKKIPWRYWIVAWIVCIQLCASIKYFFEWGDNAWYDVPWRHIWPFIALLLLFPGGWLLIFIGLLYEVAKGDLKRDMSKWRESKKIGIRSIQEISQLSSEETRSLLEKLEKE